MKLAIESQAAHSSQSARQRRDFDQDAEPFSILPENYESLTKSPFKAIAEGLNSLLSLVDNEDGEETGNFVGTPKACSGNCGAGGQGRSKVQDLNAMTGPGEQESTSAMIKDGKDQCWEMAGPTSSPVNGRTEEDGVRAGVPPQGPADPVEKPYSFPSGPFQQISFWPRLMD